MASMPEVYKNLLMIGDPKTGKTHLFYSFLRDKTPEECFLPLSNSVTHEMEVEGKKLCFGLSPIDGATSNTPSTSVDIIIMCFSLDNPDSLQNISDKWVGEMRFLWPDVPIILLGTKMDLRKNKKIKTIPKSKGKEVGQSIGAVAYMECSSLEKTGVNEVFNLAAKTVIHATTKKNQPIPKTFYKTLNDTPLSNDDEEIKEQNGANTATPEKYKKTDVNANGGKHSKNKKKSGCIII